MLEQLFGSQSRIKLLQVFLTGQDQKYFVRELTRLIDSQINAVRRELENLEEIGILKVVAETDLTIKTKHKYYQLNEKFIFQPELKSIFEKAHFLIEKKFANSLKKVGHVYYLALTGSFVGEKTVPIDMIVVGKLGKKSFEKILKNFEKNIRREINYTLLSKEEFDYRRSVADRFLYGILDSEKIVLVDEIFNSMPAVETDNLKDND